MALEVFSEDNVLKLGEEDFPLSQSIISLAKYFNVEDSGLMLKTSSDVILHRRGFNSEQIVYQFEPQIKTAHYKKREGDEDFESYELAFPWVICLISYENNQFQGIRHFYSPEPIFDIDQPLYLVNLPNTNTISYGDTSLGWVCLYHQASGNNIEPFMARLHYALERYDPRNEPYNYGNMSSTDGFQFYKNHDKPKYSWDPVFWAKKTEKEGIEWTLDSKVWIPALVASSDDFAKRYDPKGEPYTIRKALYDNHFVYYEIKGAVELNQYIKLLGDEKLGDKYDKFIQKYLRRSIVKSLKSEPPAAVKLIDKIDNFTYDEFDKNSILGLSFTRFCDKCGTHVLNTNVKSLQQNVIVRYDNEYFKLGCGVDVEGQAYDHVTKFYCENCLKDTYTYSYLKKQMAFTRVVNWPDLQSSFQYVSNVDKKLIHTEIRTLKTQPVIDSNVLIVKHDLAKSKPDLAKSLDLVKDLAKMIDEPSHVIDEAYYSGVFSRFKPTLYSEVVKPKTTPNRVVKCPSCLNNHSHDEMLTTLVFNYKRYIDFLVGQVGLWDHYNVDFSLIDSSELIKSAQGCLMCSDGPRYDPLLGVHIKPPLGDSSKIMVTGSHRGQVNRATLKYQPIADALYQKNLSFDSTRFLTSRFIVRNLLLLLVDRLGLQRGDFFVAGDSLNPNSELTHERAIQVQNEIHLTFDYEYSMREFIDVFAAKL